MDKREIKDRIDYIVMCVSEFANRFKLTNQQAYAYLRRFNGIELIMNQSSWVFSHRGFATHECIYLIGCGLRTDSQ